MILTQVYQATPYSLAPLCGHSTRVSRVGSAVRIILDRPAHALDRLLRAVAGFRFQIFVDLPQCRLRVGEGEAWSPVLGESVLSMTMMESAIPFVGCSRLMISRRRVMPRAPTF